MFADGDGRHDRAVAAERAGHSRGGALFLRRYRHLYEAEKRTQARLLEAFIRASLDGSWTDDAAGADLAHGLKAEQARLRSAGGGIGRARRAAIWRGRRR